MSWFERARAATEHCETDEYHIETRILSAMCQLAQAMPILFVPTDLARAEKERRTVSRDANNNSLL